MLYFSKIKLFIIYLIIIILSFFSFINFIDNKENFILSKKVKLGLDLQGGSYLLLVVESNPIEGLINNVIPSYEICKVATRSHFKPSNVVLISSDKAVRPTNVMGASKRLSELIFKYFSQEDNETAFSGVGRAVHHYAARLKHRSLV